jgi:hypothetical protein
MPLLNSPSMHPSADDQIDLLSEADQLGQEREPIQSVNAARIRNRGYLVFATNPAVSPDEPGYCEVYATEARTPNQAVAKVRPLVSGRRLHVYLATGKYKHELADARWVA